VNRKWVFRVLLLALVAASPAAAQVLGQTKPVASTAAVERAVEQVATGHCQEAFPLLKKSLGKISGKDLRYRAGMAAVRCAMSLNEVETAVQSLWALQRDFPDDPQVLYISTHYYSELATRASQKLAAVAPTSAQARQLEAEAMESQGRWDEAVAQYQQILGQNRQQPGIHFRLGRIALTRPPTATSVDDAKRELEAELQIDPTNAAAEFFLGEIARQAGQWNDAIPRFSKAAKLDPGFAEAYLALGMSLNAANRFSEGVGPLETYIKVLPDDPAGHYQLSLAYARTGRKEEAVRELALQQELAKKKPGGTAPQ